MAVDKPAAGPDDLSAYNLDNYDEEDTEEKGKSSRPLVGVLARTP
jgi:hypothetical protein